MAADNPTLALLRDVSNTRAFAPGPVPADAEHAILEAARWSGSAHNYQPWHLVVVRDPATVARIAAASHHIAWMAGAPLLLVVVMANQHPEWDAYDEGRLTERAMLAAEALGLGAGMGWVHAGPERDTVHRIVGAPEGAMVRSVIAFGTPAPGAIRRPTDRKPLAEIASCDRVGAGGIA